MEPSGINTVLFLAYSRSGGTLLNKCLAVMPNVVILSEVNQLGGGWGVEKENSFTTIKAQSENWYSIPIENSDFKLALPEFIEKVKGRNQVPVIRDWCHVNFNPSEHNHHSPAYELLTYQLIKDRSDLKIVVLLRDIIDVYLSSGSKNMVEFGSNYRRYLDQVMNLNALVIKYEDFCSNPQRELMKIGEYTGIKYDPEFIAKYHDYKKVNGDVQLQKESRNLNSSRIFLSDRKWIVRNRISAINNNEDFKYCNNLVGYPTGYFNKKRGMSRLNYFFKKINKWRS